MLNIVNVSIILSVMVAVMVINFLIFACSKISPCYIEFDDRKKSEMKLMKEYNIGFKKVFGIYVTTSLIIALFLVASFSSFVAMVLMVAQIIYTVGSVLVMLWMYVRSILYWENEFKKEEKRRASQLSDACVF